MNKTAAFLEYSQHWEMQIFCTLYSLPSSMLMTSNPSGSLSSSLGTLPLCVHDHVCGARWLKT